MKALLSVVPVFAAAVCLAVSSNSTASIAPLPDKVPPAVSDRQLFQPPDQVHFTGWLGARIDANATNRLARIDTGRLLEGYRHRPGRQSWDGEHVGKWLHAATLAWVYTGDPGLRGKLDETARELVRCQLDDGYLGTYVERDRWTEWDVWAHKYNLLGLITYMRYTGNTDPLPTCRRMGDLLCRTFGEAPGQRDILKAGEHVGMAPTSVLEPMVLLYRLTGETRYLDFCKYILRAWEHPEGPHIISRLLTLQRVDKVGNGKAYEMLSCLNGALEYYRTTGGPPEILEACLNAWKDIVDHRLYITGAASYHEHFHDDFDLPNVSDVGETCVTVTWEQFNAQLLRLTGEARFADQLEHVTLNQLFGAQKCDGSGWGYYVQMEGRKPYSSNLDGHCCLSSGPRGVALLPAFAWTTDADGVVINLFEAGQALLVLPGGGRLSLRAETLYPKDGKVRLRLAPEGVENFALKLRVPAWCRSWSVRVNSSDLPAQRGADGYLTLRRAWKSGDEVDLNLRIEPRLVAGDHLNAGKAALFYGPLVLAADEGLLSEGQSLAMVSLGSTDLSQLRFEPQPAPAPFQNWPGAEVYRLRGAARCTRGNLKAGDPLPLSLAAFAEAGSRGDRFRVWLPIQPASEPSNLLLDAAESQSRIAWDSRFGSIVDDNPVSFTTTRDGKKAAEDWFAAALSQPVAVRRIVFTQGPVSRDGGWFDTSGQRPRVEARKTGDGPWEALGELADYPATTASSRGTVQPGARFTLRLSEPVKVIAIRIRGTPASGDNPAAAHSTAAELAAFGE